MNKKYIIGLSMICLNESKVILRCLTSIYKSIDYWTIVDTGSTDGTQKIIEDFFKEKKIPGKLIQDHWDDDFSRVRNIALQDTEDNCVVGIWVDADEEFVGNLPKLKTNMLSAMIMTEYNHLTYYRKNVWKTGNGHRWRGPIHELLESPNETRDNFQKMEGCTIKVYPEGNSWGDGSVEAVQAKYAAHAKVLEEYVKTDFDPRWLFYLAQSFRDAGQVDKAIMWYQARAARKEGFIEECYYSALQAARLTEIKGESFYTCLEFYLRAHELDPGRGEAIRNIIALCLKFKKPELMYIFSSYGLSYHKRDLTNHRVLFIENELYQYEMLELHAYSAHSTNRKDEADMMYWTLRKEIENLPLSDQVKQRIISNEPLFKKPQNIK